MDPRVRRSVRELARARIAREHSLEMGGKVDRGLAVAGGEVECQRMPRGDGREVGGELKRVARTMAAVGGGLAREVILEAHAAMVARPGAPAVVGARGTRALAPIERGRSGGPRLESHRSPRAGRNRQKKPPGG